MRVWIVPFVVLALSGCSQEVGLKNEESIKEMGNPYSQGTGHYAGYEWAERTGGDCNGNSASFNEGCEEYFQQNDQ